MSFLRAWRRALLQATGAALVVPAAVIAAAVAVGVVGGGIRNVGSLGQALTGPAIPASEPAPEPRLRLRDESGELLARAIRPSGRRAPRAAPGAAAPGADTELAGRRRAERPARRRQAPARRRPAAASPARPASPPPAEPPRRSRVRELGDRAKQVTGQVPVAGEPAARVVDAIVEVAEQVPVPDEPQRPGGALLP